ncbi:COP9 signalosome complex subunit 8 [Geranomyces variabilis]|nr:COP9 signalosome complex subunit 8 [Geranomyces variabilis]
MEELCRLVTTGDVAGAISAGEQLEFNLALSDLAGLPSSSSNASTTSSGTTPEFYTVLQLCHLINGDVAGARSVAKRSQTIVQTSADAATSAALELAAVTNLAEWLAARDMPAAHRLMAAHAWSAPVVATLIDALRAAVRERTLALLAAAYENIAIDRVAATLGMVDLDEVAAKVLERGWKVEDGGRWLVPPPNAEQLGMAGAHNGVAPGENINSGLSQLASLARMVVHLEFV